MKKIITTLLSAVVLSAASATEFTVHHAPGGPSDRATRAIAKYLPAEYVVVNRPGAGGRIAVKHLLKTDSILLATMGQIYVTNQISGVETGYNTKSDLEILGTAATMPNVLACKKSLAINKIADLDGKNFNYGVAGYGSSEHIATEALFAKIKGNNQVIPYAQGGATAVVDLLAGNLDCMFANYPTIKPFITDERVTVLLSSHELGLGIPTWRNIYREDFPFQSYLSVIVSKNMDQDKRRKITRDLEAVFNTDSFRTDLKNIGFFVVAKTDDKTTKQVDAAMDKLRAFILLNSIKIQ
jgi:tripartite-type tricarboxylate transporter receptor subunit TctC